MSAIRLGAASMAYRSFNFNKDRRNVPNTNDEARIHADIPVWLSQFATQLPENDIDTPVGVVEPTYHKKERLYSTSPYSYERFAWYVYSNITSTAWFEGFIMLAILLIAINTGVELEIEGSHPHQHELDHYFHLTSKVTLGIFIMECALKIIAEGFEPWNFFFDIENGGYNTFDFVIVMMSLVFAKSTGSMIGGFRMLKLIRLLTFTKNVPQLRMILAGLIHGVKSVSYVVILLSLVLYIFAILGCILFGQNDPNHFGGVGIAMLSLFQVSTLSSWTDIAYISWYGCEDYIAGITNKPTPTATGLFYATYIVFTGWVIMSIFIGVISMGMFESYLTLKEEMVAACYIKRLAENTMREAVALKSNTKKTLKYRIEQVLNDSEDSKLFQQASVESNESSRPLQLFDQYVYLCQKICHSDVFVGLITLTIVLVGVFSGVDTNHTLHCGRLRYQSSKHDDQSDIYDRIQHCEHTDYYLTVIFLFAQAIFTLECLLKIGAEGTHPLNYFLDEENGSWNRLDFGIVLVGFFEMSHVQIAFPVFALRLVRLVRLLRLAKAFPKLRAIVEAVISSVANVGWICLLIIVFNYIIGCLCIVFFRSNDPFHFGSVGRAMFTVLRLETLDKWDQILYIAMYGCDKYPDGYEFLQNNPSSSCEHGHAAGYLGALVVFIVAFLGAYVLPTVLIGIVSIKFDNATRTMQVNSKERARLDRHLTLAREAIPDYFTCDRMEDIKTLFDRLDANNKKMLDLNEFSPFLQYTMDYLFDIELLPHQVESLFYLCGTSDHTELGFGEFVTLISILKQMHIQMKRDPSYATQVFDRSGLLIKKQQSFSCHGKSKWDAAMDRVDKDSLNSACLVIIRVLKEASGKNVHEKISTVFKPIDADSNGELSCSELGVSLKSCGLLLNDRELLALIHVVDRTGRGSVGYYDLMKQVETIVCNHDEFNHLSAVQHQPTFQNMSRTPSIAGNQLESNSLKKKEGSTLKLVGNLDGKPHIKQEMSINTDTTGESIRHSFELPTTMTPANRIAVLAGIPVVSINESSSSSSSVSSTSRCVCRTATTPVRAPVRRPSIDQKPPKSKKNHRPETLEEALKEIERLKLENEVLRGHATTFTTEMLHDWMSHDEYKHSAEEVNGELRHMSKDEKTSMGQKI